MEFSVTDVLTARAQLYKEERALTSCISPLAAGQYSASESCDNLSTTIKVLGTHRLGADTTGKMGDSCCGGNFGVVCGVLVWSLP